MDPVMRETGDKFVVILNDHIERSRSVMDFNGAVQINAIDWMNKAIMDITGKVAFGYDFKFGMAPEAELILKVLSEMNRTRQSPGGFVAPLVLRAFPFITSLPMESIQAEGEVKTTTKELGRRLLRERKLLDENGDARGHDYLSALRNMYNVHTEDSIELDGILDQIATLIVAAQENSPSTLAHILYALSHDKDAQNRLRQELLSFSSTSLEGEPTYAEYQTQLPFLDAVLKEILRLHPTTGWSERVALEDDVLPLNVPIRDGSGKEVKFVDVKAGQVAVVPHLAINRSNEVFPDPDEFRPERWLTSPPSPDKMMPKGWNGLATFIEGPHICIGLRLALHEIRVLLSTLVKNFEFLPVEGPDGKVEDLLGATLRTFIVGRREDGPCIPVMIRPIHA
ncbi:hypothetical protein FRB95_010183 [Tulasnella sp. JGI-2019a]|nr:hypothetical protein FRB95_010183 [Tulasnella sp. JGI-2019a]